MMRTLALIAVATLGTIATTVHAADPTYAERLGWKAGDRVVIIHVDDAAMSHDSNVGALRPCAKGSPRRSA